MEEYLKPLLWLTILIGIFVFAAKLQSRSKKKLEELKPIDKVSVGKYIAGIPTANTPVDALCTITNENDIVKSFMQMFLIVFLVNFGLGNVGSELGRIPRDRINQIIIDDKTQISQRLTVTRMLTLGIFSLAAPKKKKHVEFCLVIDWNDEKGIRNNTIFEFTGSLSNTLANKAANTLNKYVKSRTAIMEADEKTCPYCAEKIKKAAKLCRFCNRDV